MGNIINPSRRGFIAGLGALVIAAPAIVRASSLMPVRAWREIALPEPPRGFIGWGRLQADAIRDLDTVLGRRVIDGEGENLSFRGIPIRIVRNF